VPAPRGRWSWWAHCSRRSSTCPGGAAVNRFETVAYGGTALDDARAQQALADVGLDAVTTAPTPVGSPAITVGRKPA
jgi:hypothetical protein